MKTNPPEFRNLHKLNYTTFTQLTMGFFVIRNFSVPCRTLSRCMQILKNNSIRTETSKLHTFVRKDVSTGTTWTSSTGIYTSLYRGRPVVTGPEWCFKLKSHNNVLLSVRFMATRRPKNNNTVWYVVALIISMLGMAYAGVPLFKVFCQQFGMGGNTEFARVQNADKVVEMQRIPDRKIRVTFVADRHSGLQWNFKPQQEKIEVSPGETALAFYSANNPTEKPIVGVATYSVVPYAAAPYFHKIQCFCFEEQILNPHEHVDMPVFFYIDPDYDIDPELERENDIVLSYTFFEAKEGMTLPVPGSYTSQPHLNRQ